MYARAAGGRPCPRARSRPAARFERQAQLPFGVLVTAQDDHGTAAFRRNLPHHFADDVQPGDGHPGAVRPIEGDDRVAHLQPDVLPDTRTTVEILGGHVSDDHAALPQVDAAEARRLRYASQPLEEIGPPVHQNGGAQEEQDKKAFGHGAPPDRFHNQRMAA